MFGIQKKVQHGEKKDREKARKRGSRKYGQANKKHSKKGIYSCVMAGGMLLLVIALLAGAFITNGKMAAITGACGIGALILAWSGIVMGIKGFREREKNYTTCKVGIGCNGFFVLLFIMIFIRGLI